MKLAVIDLGSNSARIGIYQNENGFEEIDRVRYNVRLAEGLEKDNLLKKEPMERTLKAFVKFKEIILQHNCQRVIAISTESLRRAENSDVFVQAVKEKTGIQIEIIDGKKECEYGAIAAQTSTSYKDFYVLDVGGGSFELSKVKEGKIKDCVCLPYGCVVMTEQFKPDDGGKEQLSEFLKNVFRNIDFVNESLPVVALGGSAKEIAKYVFKGTDKDEFDKMEADAEKTYELYEKLAKTKVSDRHKVFNMEKARCDIIHAGLLTILTLIETAKSEKIVFCTKSIREGVAISILK